MSVSASRCTLAQREKQYTMGAHQHAAFSWSRACEHVVPGISCTRHGDMHMSTQLLFSALLFFSQSTV